MNNSTRHIFTLNLNEKNCALLQPSPIDQYKKFGMLAEPTNKREPDMRTYTHT
jgi:hypothetical protein